MTKTLTHIAAGTFGFVGTVADSAAQTMTDTASSMVEVIHQAQPALENPGTYGKAAIVSGLIQLGLKLIEKLPNIIQKLGENRRARRAAKAAKTV